MLDIRLLTAFPSHPKTKKLLRRLGPSGPWHLICLFLWARDSRPDGNLSGMSDEDIEIAVDWPGEPGAFVGALVAVGFLDGEEGQRVVHDWEQHQPWSAGARDRSESARWAALCRQRGKDEAARLMPDYAYKLYGECDPHSKTLRPASDPQATRSADECDPHAACVKPQCPVSVSVSDSVSESLKATDSDESVVTSGDHCPHADIVAAYHAELPMCPRVRIWDAGRQAKLRARWREDKSRQTVGWWAELFAYIRNNCPFLVGQVNSPGREPFLASLEWIITPSNFRKVIEGNYERRAA